MKPVAKFTVCLWVVFLKKLFSLSSTNCDFCLQPFFCFFQTVLKSQKRMFFSPFPARTIFMMKSCVLAICECVCLCICDSPSTRQFGSKQGTVRGNKSSLAWQTLLFFLCGFGGVGGCLFGFCVCLFGGFLSKKSPDHQIRRPRKI